MARDGTGTAFKVVPDFEANTVILDTEMNSLIDDMIDMLTQSVSKDGQTEITGNLVMANHKLTELLAGTAATDSLSLGQSQAEAMVWAATATGTADALLLNLFPTVTAYAAGQRFVFISSASPNTGATTVNIDSVGIEDIENDGSALVAGDIEASKMYQILYDGTAFQITKINLAVRGITEGDVDADNNTMSQLDLQDYSELKNDLGSIGGGTQDIDLELGNTVSGTLDTSETTFTFSNPSPATSACYLTFVLTNGGSQDVNWPASVRWPSGVEPILTASGVDILVFLTLDSGTIWHGVIASTDSTSP